MLEGQNSYGERDADLVMSFWEWKLSSRFTADQVIFALDKYTDDNYDFPTPAGLIEILQPQEPRITESQYISAQKAQERNNWPMLSEEQTIIDKYREQMREDHRDHSIKCERIQLLAESNVKRLVEKEKI